LFCAVVEVKRVCVTVGTGSLEKKGGRYFVTGNKFKNRSRNEGGCQKLKWNRVEMKVQNKKGVSGRKWRNKWVTRKEENGEMNRKYEKQEKLK
jgi:hypothetical protein